MMLVLLAVVVFGEQVSAQTTTISLNPSTVKDVAVGGTFSMDVTIAGASNVYGWQANVTFDPGVLSVDGVTEGSFLKNVNATVWLAKIDNDKGQVLFSSSFNVPYPSAGASGDAVLATITFKVKSGGGSVLAFGDRTYVNTVQGANVIKIATTSQGGTFGTVATGGGLGISMELLAVIGIVIVVAVAGGALYLKKRRE